MLNTRLGGEHEEHEHHDHEGHDHDEHAHHDHDGHEGHDHSEHSDHGEFTVQYRFHCAQVANSAIFKLIGLTNSQVLNR